MRVATLVAAALVAAAGLAAASPAAERSVLYNVQGSPSDWVPFGSAGASDRLTFVVALKQRNLERLDATFWEVSDPKSDRYQQYMTPAQINELVRPAPEAFHAVREWLSAAGVPEAAVEDLGDALKVRTTVAVAEPLFQTTFRRYLHNSGSRLVRAAAAYSVPSAVREHIDMVAGLTEFPQPRNRIRKAAGSGNDYQIVPQTLRALYGVPAENTEGNHSVGVIEFEGLSFAPSDLATFSKQTGVKIPPVDASRIVGENSAGSIDGEPTLDIEWAAGVAPGAESWFWVEGGETWLYGWATHFLNTADVPEVVSISYGWNEEQQCEQGIGSAGCERLGIDSATYVARTNTEFQKIGLRGVSILASSGDSGANGRSDGGCQEQHLNPSFPASSPFVTAVGANQLVNTVQLQDAPKICSSEYGVCAAGTNGVEQAVSYDVAEFASGGGFSDISARPAYQAAAVDQYLASGVALPPSSFYSGTNRGYPDVSALGINILIFQESDNGVSSTGGTSASTPIFAAVVSRLNAAAKAKNGKTLGFLNPLLYQAAAAQPNTFNDVTVGDNKCTEEGCSGCKGFEAAAGWDPVTGLGSPSYPNLLNYIQNN